MLTVSITMCLPIDVSIKQGFPHVFSFIERLLVIFYLDYGKVVQMLQHVLVLQIKYSFVTVFNMVKINT